MMATLSGLELAPHQQPLLQLPASLPAQAPQNQSPVRGAMPPPIQTSDFTALAHDASLPSQHLASGTATSTHHPSMSLNLPQGLNNVADWNPLSSGAASPSLGVAPGVPGSRVAPARFIGIGNERARHMSVSEDGFFASNASNDKWAGARCVVYASSALNAGNGVVDAIGAGGAQSGIYYFEVTQRDAVESTPTSPHGSPASVISSGILRVGFASSTASLALGTDDDSFGYGATGVKCSGTLRYDATPRPGQPSGSAFAPYGCPFDRGDVIGATLNLAHGTISFSVNGIDQGVAFELPPELRSTARFHPAITIKGCAAQLNLGQAPLRHKPPFAQPFAAAGVVDELAIPQEVRGQVIGRSWATTQFDTSAHLISRETHALTQRDGGW